MRIEQWTQWSWGVSFSAWADTMKSAWTTLMLCGLIISGVLGIVLLKYKNHCMYSELRHLEQRAQQMYQQQQAWKGQKVHLLNVVAVEAFMREKSSLSES